MTKQLTYLTTRKSLILRHKSSIISILRCVFPFQCNGKKVAGLHCQRKGDNCGSLKLKPSLACLCHRPEKKSEDSLKGSNTLSICGSVNTYFCEPIFKWLGENTWGKWNESQEALDKNKQYLEESIIPSTSNTRKALTIIYQCTSDTFVKCVPKWHDDVGRKPKNII